MMSRPKPNAARPGFTLTEVLIASAILAGAVLGLTMPFSIAAKHQRTDSIQTTAASLASERMERLLAARFGQLPQFDGVSESGENITNMYGVPMREASFADFSLSISIEPVQIIETDDPSDMVLATVTVTHPDISPVKVARLVSE